MKQFFLAGALTFALAAGAETVLTAQLTLAAAQTLTLGFGTLTGLNVQPQPATACPSTRQAIKIEQCSTRAAGHQL